MGGHVSLLAYAVGRAGWGTVVYVCVVSQGHQKKRLTDIGELGVAPARLCDIISAASVQEEVEGLARTLVVLSIHACHSFSFLLTRSISLRAHANNTTSLLSAGRLQERLVRAARASRSPGGVAGIYATMS